jgi:hypothetical protein
MSGFITQNRSTITKLYSDIGTGPAGLNNFANLTSDQTTTSFRSSVQDFRQELSVDSKVTYNPFINTNPDDKTDRGHVFSTVKRVEILNRPKADLSSESVYPFIHGWKGPLYPLVKSGLVVDFPQLSPMSSNDVKVYGQLAIAKCEPTLPEASLSTFLSEIFFADQELPHVKYDDILKFQVGLGHLSSHGRDAFLSTNFAWLPFCNDLRKLMNAVKNSYKIMSQYKRDSGRVVRRRFRFEPVSTYKTTTNSTGDVWSPYAMPEKTGSSHDAIYEQSLKTEIWFSGAFMYYLPVTDSLLHKMEYYDRLADRVLGSDFTPLTIWNIAPWSWLLDWKLDLGSAISIANSMSEHNLVLSYGYLMRKQTALNKLTVPGLSFVKSGKLGPVSRTLSVVMKERFQATPYGFGIDPGTFSATQLAILVALGIKRE